MIICIGGSLCSGRHALAKDLAKRLNFRHLPMRNLPARGLYELQHRERDGKQSLIDDVARLEIFKKAAGELALLVKMYDGVVISEPFHRKKPRDFLLNAARKTGPVLMVWVQAKESVARDLSHRVTLGDSLMRPEGAWKMHKDMEATFEPFDFPVPLFQNDGNENNKQVFYDFINQLVS